MGLHHLYLATATILATSALVAHSQTGMAAAAASQPTDLPLLPEIMADALARAETQDEAKAELRFESIIETVSRLLNGDGDTTKTDTLLSRRYPIAGSVYEEVITRNGRSLTANERRDETKKRKDFRRKAQEAAARGEVVETNDERQVRFDVDLMTRYHASVVGEAVIENDTCWVVAFEPREGRQPEKTRMDRALNRSTGRIYITQADAAVSRIEFELQRPVSYVWGFISSLRHASGRLDFERVEPNVWLPKRFDIRIDLRILFRTTRRHIVRTWVERMRTEPG